VVVAVAVIGPVIVAVHLNGNATVIERDRGDHAHGGVPVQVHGHGHGGGNDHDNDYDRGVGGDPFSSGTRSVATSGR